MMMESIMHFRRPRDLVYLEQHTFVLIALMKVVEVMEHLMLQKK